MSQLEVTKILANFYEALIFGSYTQSRSNVHSTFAVIKQKERKRTLGWQIALILLLSNTQTRSMLRIAVIKISMLMCKYLFQNY